MKVLVLLTSRAVFSPDNKLIHKNLQTCTLLETLIVGVDHIDNQFPEKILKYFLP